MYVLAICMRKLWRDCADAQARLGPHLSNIQFVYQTEELALFKSQLDLLVHTEYDEKSFLKDVNRKVGGMTMSEMVWRL